MIAKVRRRKISSLRLLINPLWLLPGYGFTAEPISASTQAVDMMAADRFANAFSLFAVKEAIPRIEQISPPCNRRMISDNLKESRLLHVAASAASLQRNSIAVVVTQDNIAGHALSQTLSVNPSRSDLDKPENRQI
jgi:hypothetical protein